jgi:hypothetical protein
MTFGRHVRRNQLEQLAEEDQYMNHRERVKAGLHGAR